MSKANSVKDVANIVKILDNRTNNSNISLLNKDGQVTSTPEESLECLMSTHFIENRKETEHEEDIRLMEMNLTEETKH